MGVAPLPDMPSSVNSFYQDQFDPKPISIELHTRFQIPSFQILGLPAPEIQEARERIVAAFTASDFEFPKRRVVVNLAPSSVRKSGTGHDLAIAIKVLQSVLDFRWPERIYAWGELGLNGEVKPAGNMASLIELLLNDPEEKTVFVSPEDLISYERYLAWREAHSLPLPLHTEFVSISMLSEIESRFKGEIPPLPPRRFAPVEMKASEVKSLPCALLPLSPQLERLLLIAHTGRHHLLLLGPKGVGKSQALDWFTELMPESTPTQTWQRCLYQESREALERAFQPPVRRVHAQVKPSHLLGSFSQKGLRAGELSLAHGGMFIADEFLEWPRDSKEALREPLQSKQYSLTRAQGQARLECDFQFVGTGNLCPCGGLPALFKAFLGASSSKQKCRCRPSAVQDYLAKLSGPIADRIDLIHVLTDGPVKREDALSRAELQKRILRSRSFAVSRFGALSSELSVPWLEENLPSSEPMKKLLAGLPNLRARHKVMRVARTLQALEESPELKEEHLFESISYRFTDRYLE